MNAAESVQLHFLRKLFFYHMTLLEKKLRKIEMEREKERARERA